MVRTNDEAKNPVVKFQPHNRWFLFLLMSRHASLEVKPEALGSIVELIGTPYIVLSCSMV